MPTLTEAIQETAVRLWKRIMHIDRDHGLEDIQQSLIGTYLRALGTELAHVLLAMYDILRTWDVDRTFGEHLTLKARDYGVFRRHDEPVGEPDEEWLRERTKLWIYVQQSHGTPQEIRYAAAWFLGILTRDKDWKTTILPKLSILENDEIPYSYDARSIPCRYMLVVPHTLLEIETEPAFEFTLAPEWEYDPAHGFDGGIVGGRLSISDMVDFLELAGPAGVKSQIWRSGWEMTLRPEWEYDPNLGFDAAPLSAPSDTFVLKVTDEYDFRRLRAYWTERPNWLGQRAPHPYATSEIFVS